MRRSRPSGSVGCWPDARQQLLIGAAFWEGERARSAWRCWCAATPREQITYADSRLLAGAYRHLRDQGVDDPTLTLAGGLHRRAWYMNQFALNRAAAVVSDLGAAGIEVIALKGTALALRHYRHVGDRPIGDVDLLVDPHRLRDALATLLANGWQLLPTQRTVDGPLRHATHVVAVDGHQIDLHGYALMQSADDADLWESRVPLDLMGAPTSALGPEQQLLHVCVHGLRWEGTVSRWPSDAMAILKGGGTEFDWARLIERTQARRLTVAVAAALAWLREQLDADIPGWVLTSLRRGPRLRFERTVQSILIRPPRPMSFAVMSYDRYRRFKLLGPAGERPASFASFLRSAWEIDKSRDLLVHGGRKLLRAEASSAQTRST